MDRSTRNLSIIILLVLAIFLALNHIATRAALADWGLVLLFLLLALGIWFYDRVSRRGVDDDEIVDTVIEPVVYDHQGAPISIPDTIELVPPNPATVIHAAPHAPVVHTESPAVAAPTTLTHVEKTVPPPVVTTPPPQPEPTGQPPTTADLPAPRMTEENARAPMPESVLETASGLPTEVKEVSSEPSVQQPASDSAVTTTIEEKSAPPASSPAAETHPDLTAKAPHGGNLPSSPVDDKKASKPVPSPVPGSAPEPIAPRSSTEPVPNIPAKDMPHQPAMSTPAQAPRASTPSTLPVASDVKVSASKVADATPTAPDPNLPINAVPGKPDDLKIIEGIGPKMEKALQAAGISTYAMLAGASENQIQDAITAAGMRFAPSVPTWAEQASYAANGDFVGLEAFQKTLVGGRKSK